MRLTEDCQYLKGVSNEDARLNFHKGHTGPCVISYQSINKHGQEYHKFYPGHKLVWKYSGAKKTESYGPRCPVGVVLERARRTNVDT